MGNASVSGRIPPKTGWLDSLITSFGQLVLPGGDVWSGAGCGKCGPGSCPDLLISLWPDDCDIFGCINLQTVSASFIHLLLRRARMSFS